MPSPSISRHHPKSSLPVSAIARIARRLLAVSSHTIWLYLPSILKSLENSASTQILQQTAGCRWRGTFARLVGSMLSVLQELFRTDMLCSPIMSQTPVMGENTIVKLGIFDEVPKPMFESYTKDRRPFLKPFEGAAQKWSVDRNGNAMKCAV